MMHNFCKKRSSFDMLRVLGFCTDLLDVQVVGLLLFM